MTTRPAPSLSTRSLGDRFWRLWTATTVSAFGDGLQVTALPLLAVSLSRDPILVSGVTAAATLPWLVFSLPAGAIADRRDRRRLMWQVNTVRTVLVGLVALLVATGWMVPPVLYLLVFASGLGQTLFETSSQAILPDLVSDKQIASANGKRQAGEMVGLTFVGPPLGGVLFAAVAAVPFAIDAGTFAVAALLIAAIPGAYTAVEPSPVSKTSMWTEIKEGLRWLAGHDLLRPMAVVLGLANLGVFMAEGVLVLFATKELGLSRPGFGLLLTTIAVGGVVGALVSARIAAALGTARTIALAVVVLGVGHLVVGLLSQAVAAAAALALVGFAGSTWNIVTISLRQTVIPRRLLGRVNSAYRLVGMGSMPLGALLGGGVASLLGLRAPFIAAALLLAVALAISMARITGPAIAAAQERAAREALQPTGPGEAV